MYRLCEQRPDWSVDHASCKNCFGVGSAFTFEEPTREFASSVGFLRYINCQGQKVCTGSAFFRGCRSCQQHRVAVPDCNGTAGLHGYSTVLDFEYSPANFHFKFVNHFFFIYFF